MEVLVDTGSSDLLVATTLCKPCDEVYFICDVYYVCICVCPYVPQTTCNATHATQFLYRKQVTVSRSGPNDPVRPLLDLEKANGACVAFCVHVYMYVCVCIYILRSIYS
jgi:hypothetical protein